MATSREDIAAALSGVVVTWNGVAYPLDGQGIRPPALAVWQAFPDWVAAVWRSQCVVERTWSVYVILPAADPDAWATATDAALKPVRDALIRVGSVTRVEPVSLVVADQSSSMPALNFTLLT